MERFYSSHFLFMNVCMILFHRCQQRFPVYEYVHNFLGCRKQRLCQIPLFEYMPDLFHFSVISLLYSFRWIDLFSHGESLFLSFLCV